MKRILSLILVLVMLCGMMPMNTFAAEVDSETQSSEPTVVTEATKETEAAEPTKTTESPEDIVETEPILVCTYENEENSAGYISSGTCGAELLWTLDSDGTLTITGTGEMTSWGDEYSVPWSAYRDQIKKVTISEGVTTIGAYAFKLCTGLVDVTIPVSVVSIEGRAFYGCSSLSSIDFADGITDIEDKAFKDCIGLANVVLPANLTSLGYGVFSNCSNLRSVVIPASVTHMRDYTFYSCSKLSEVVFLGDAPSLKSSVFYAVKATVYYPCDNSTWTSSNMLNYGGALTWEAMHNNRAPTSVTTPTCTEKGYTTYTCECGDSYVDDHVDAAGHSYVSGVCTTCGAHTPAWDIDGDGVLEFIAIGNSFTVDALTYAYEIAEDLGVENIVIGQLTIGGSGLSEHTANATGDLAKYRYRCNVNGDLSDTTTHEHKISTALEERGWDYIILQQRYIHSGVESTYNEDLTNLVAYLKERSDAKLVWHMTWAIQQDVVDDIYNNDQMTMYNAIVSCVKNKIVTNSDFDRIIPSGTALQNSRTSELGDTDTRDGYHMSYDYGRYLTGLMVIKTITGLRIDDITYAPPGVDAQKMAIAIESVNNAYSNPFAVTDSQYVHTHSYTPAVTTPTCTQQGYTTYTCACGDSYVDGYMAALGHTYTDGACDYCGEESIIPDGWLPMPISLEEVSSHLAYKIEDGVLTFRDFGEPAAEDYGRMPNYTNTSEVETKYDITAWYQARNGITAVVFDETISYIGSYTLTNMNQITEIHVENENAELSRNMVLFSTTDRETALCIYAASSVHTVESWIRGNNNRKLSAAVSDAIMYCTDLEYLAEDLRTLEDALLEEGKADAAVLYRALKLLKDVSWNDYSVSDYKMAIPGAEEILELLRDLSFGSCGDGLTYQLTAMEEEGKLNLTINGTGAMGAYTNADQAPWNDVAACISDITVGDGVTGITDGVLPKDATYHVYLNSEAYTYAAENECAIQIDTLRVLCIGNSHTADYSEFRANILADMKNAGMETEIVFSRSMIGSIGLYSGRNSNVNATYRSHLEALRGQSGAYSSLKNNRYDLIIVQDYMESVVDEPEVFAAGLASFIQELKSISKENGNGEPQIAWFADWVDIRTTGGDSALYDGEGNKISLDKQSREQVYEKSLASITGVEAAIVRGVTNMPNFVIHGSTIKQNAMSSYLGTTKLWDKSDYCLLERDTTHLTYELGRYLLGAGVLSEIVTHYGPILTLGEKWTNVGTALTVENGPDASGSGSQYEGAVNEELLTIIREAISSPNEFRQSVYVTDPVDVLAQQLSTVQWNTEQVTDEESALICAAEQVDAAMGGEVDDFTVELKEYDSTNQFAVLVQLRHGYSIREAEIAIHHCEYKSVVTAPTCTEQGYTTYTCDCGDSYVDDYVEALGHEYSAGLCTVCGEDTVTVSLDGNVLTLAGELAEGTRILVACYDGDGRFTDVRILIWQGSHIAEEIPLGEKVKLFFVDENWSPLRKFIPLR